MKITIEPTDFYSEMAGCPLRMWHGTTESGARVFAFVALVRASEEDELAAEAELSEALHDVSDLVTERTLNHG